MSTAASALRAASVIALVQYGVHTFLFLSKGPRGHELGYGLMVILSGAVEVAALWLLATMARGGDRRAMPLVGLFFAANLGHAVLALAYFFPAPALFDAAVAACLATALVAARRAAGLGSAARELQGT